ncbi:alpha/beta hydrolase [Acuticoccus mangrovi]|uniref:Alpha/beta hydrolase n=1 Tax=Acuticoccus mangrovi TaxID=2796142 RepID=A0A934MD13_9HYPH|nr:alpha/beta hydrolase [Acuticoccus mangrovi]MBJ3775842.1 alpha/beta hydrolase [Acuticoccus mangrovi]
MTETLYRGMDRAELDRQYNARNTVPDFTIYVDEYRARTDAAKAAGTAHLDVAYGSAEMEVCDIYPVPGEAKAPVFVYIHGGYWRAMTKDESGFMAPQFAAAGIATVALSYSLAPAVTLETIVEECRRAIAFLYREGAGYGLDPERIVVAGSSAGGHLTGVTITGDWQAGEGVPADVVKAAMPMSGLMDLEPIRLCHVNDWLGLDAARAAAMSPLSLIDAGPAEPPILTVVGGDETAEFRRQTHDFAAAWRDAGRSGRSMEVPGRNHFDTVLEFTKPDSDLFAETVALIRSL